MNQRFGVGIWKKRPCLEYYNPLGLHHSKLRRCSELIDDHGLTFSYPSERTFGLFLTYRVMSSHVEKIPVFDESTGILEAFRLELYQVLISMPTTDSNATIGTTS